MVHAGAFLPLTLYVSLPFGLEFSMTRGRAEELSTYFVGGGFGTIVTIATHHRVTKGSDALAGHLHDSLAESWLILFTG